MWEMSRDIALLPGPQTQHCGCRTYMLKLIAQLKKVTLKEHE